MFVLCRFLCVVKIILTTLCFTFFPTFNKTQNDNQIKTTQPNATKTNSTQRNANQFNPTQRTATQTNKTNQTKTKQIRPFQILQGYGLLFDLSDNATAHKLVTTAYESQKPIAAVCHGPAALAKIKLSDDETFLIADKQVTGFTREEEVAMGTLDAIPYLLEEKMMEGGAVYRKKAAWKELVVVDGLLITGQNPQSAHGVGKALAAMLKKE